MQLFDTLTLDGVRKTADGYLAAEVRAARAGIQTYLGAEVDPSGKRFAPDSQVRVYRPESEVFNKDSLHSFAHRPVTLDHPPEAVTADNWRRYAVGQTGDEVVRDGEFVRVPMVLMDAAAIKAVEAGSRQLSMGYSTELKFEDGLTPQGEAYDAVQTALSMNHLAVVRRARGGPDLKIGDVEGEPDMPDNLKTVAVDGLSVSTTDQGAQAIAKLQADRDAARTEATEAKDEHAKALAAKDADLAKKDAEIDDLKAKVLDAAAMDAAVQKRADLIDRARKVAPKVETKGLTDAEIRKAVVTAVRGADAVKDKSDAYIDAAFDLLADAKPKNPLTSAIEHSQQQDSGDPEVQRGAAYDAYLDGLNNTQPAKKEA
ncbi:DUF2213 domain-containing protein [Marinicauda sp. Alg238-R41]|uniref:DUF2213 domain-containing protein n=1 Tax=Marinicauda sp. Alg238-R41 TaxID=2993447 RepID=UPI0022E44B55|nr:DUF2213 domain-containing protein [Marinicauda sp. Alg238-R41]